MSNFKANRLKPNHSKYLTCEIFNHLTRSAVHGCRADFLWNQSLRLLILKRCMATTWEQKPWQVLIFVLKREIPLGFWVLNGAGKTTLISILCGILSPSSGSVRVFGQDLFKKGALSKKTGGSGPPGYCPLSNPYRTGKPPVFWPHARPFGQQAIRQR